MGAANVNQGAIGASGAQGVANLQSLNSMQEQIGMAAKTEEIRNGLFQSILQKMKPMQF